MTEAQREQVIGYAFERYTRAAALFGSPSECRGMLDRAAAVGVDEIACLIDFGVDDPLVLEALTHLDAMRPTRPVVSVPGFRAAIPLTTVANEPIAVIGMSGRFPGAPDLDAFWDNLCAGRDALSAPPAGRGGPDLPPRGGYLDDLDGFDSELFGIAPAEAAIMDPHQRIFLEQVWAAVENAGYRPSELRGSATGVFAAIYSTSHESTLRARGEALDGLSVAGAVLSMVPNRTSFLFDWTGPSEAVNTACSSGLVAVHRAAAALRMGECRMAIAGGVSLLLAPEETAALARLGVLSHTGVCRAFDLEAEGQVRGEGAGVVALKRLSDAGRDGNFVYALIRGSAVNHGGARGNSLTMPNPRLQAACMVDALTRSGVSAHRIGYIEAHGAGTAIGDLAELSAFTQAFATLGAAPAAKSLVGSVKSNIGSLDAAGGIAGLIKAVLALHHRTIPATLNRRTDPDGFDPSGPLGFADRTQPWDPPTDGMRAACVHAYGLGGTNANVVLDEYTFRADMASTSGPVVVAVSARSDAALRATLGRLTAWLDAPRHGATLADIAHTLSVGRENWPHRWSVVVSDLNDLRSALRRGPVNGTTDAVGSPTPTQGRRIPLPGTAFDRVSPSVVGSFYDSVTRAEEREGEIYLTLAPFPAIVPGFSWTRSFQDPDRNPGHWAILQAAQREMREVLFSGVDFTAVRTMLDFGCGVGTDLIVLAQAHPHLIGIGYTISERQAGIAKARVAAEGMDRRLSIHHRDSARDPFPSPVDLIFGLEVAHHIADKTALFSNIASHLTSDGYLLLADCAANTVAPINLPDVGSFTTPKADYADLLANQHLEITECVDLSQEVANFLHDPGLDAMLAEEATRGGPAVRLVASVQRSWDGFGQALRSGLLSYLLITARKRPDATGLVARNRQHLGLT